MPASPNGLRWQGEPGHYEVYYVTLTDPGSGIGIWIRYTMLAPLPHTGQAPSCALWFATMDPRPGSRGTFARKASFPIAQLTATEEPFALRIGAAELDDHGADGELGDVRWSLRWAASARAYEHVHPLLRRARAAQTLLVLAQGDLSIDGTVTIGEHTLQISGARGGQAHLWGSKHAQRWTWAHCNDFTRLDGEPQPGTMVDAVSVVVSRLGREIGPSTPVVGRIEDEEFHSTSPARVVANTSMLALTGWRFEATAGKRKLIGEVDADRDLLAGVTYEDPDGERAYCYNGETATMRLQILDRARRVGGWAHRGTLISRGGAHFEYGQRETIPGLELQIT